MPALNKRPVSGALLSIIILLILAACLCGFGIINFLGFAHFCTTDMYEDTLVARLIWENKTLFPDNYLFGNQFYVIATPVLAALFYGITGSMNLSMGLATTVMSLLILLSLNWMLKPFVKKPQLRYTALLLMTAASFGPHTITREDGQLFFVMCSFYACYLIAFFFLLGDYARSRESQELRPIAFAIALFLSFCTGMQSLRQTCVSMLPILCFEFLTVFIRLIKRQPLCPSEKRMSLIRAACYLASNILGIIFIKLLGVQRNEIFYGQSIFSGASIREKIKAVHEALVTVSGYDFTRNGAEPFFVLFFIFTTLLIVAAAIILIRGHKLGGPAVFWWVCIISICAVIAASFVTSVSLRPIYLFPYYTLPTLSFAVIVTKLKPKWQNALCAAVALLVSLNMYYSYHDQISYSLKPDRIVQEEISDYAIENGYELVYGSHSHTAPGIAAQSDGKLIAGCWTDDHIFKVSPHINIKDVYYLTDYSRAIFVFTENELPLALKETEANGTELYFEGQFGQFHVYTASKQLLYPISENINQAWLFPEYN